MRWEEAETETDPFMAVHSSLAALVSEVDETPSNESVISALALAIGGDIDNRFVPQVNVNAPGIVPFAIGPCIDMIEYHYYEGACYTLAYSPTIGVYPHSFNHQDSSRPTPLEDMLVVVLEEELSDGGTASAIVHTTSGATGRSVNIQDAMGGAPDATKLIVFRDQYYSSSEVTEPVWLAVARRCDTP